MKKIPTLFKRDFSSQGGRLVTPEVTEGCEWILNGEGVATLKWDGTCCLIKEGVLYKRYDAKHGKQPPPGFIPAQEADPITGHWPGWLKVGEGPEDKYFREPAVPTQDGTYELIGPKINGNRDGSESHVFKAHGDIILHDAPRTFEDLKNYLEDFNYEGIVWHHPDGRMAKIKKSDFGFNRSLSNQNRKTNPIEKKE